MAARHSACSFGQDKARSGPDESVRELPRVKDHLGHISSCLNALTLATAHTVVSGTEAGRG